VTGSISRAAYAFKASENCEVLTVDL